MSKEFVRNIRNTTINEPLNTNEQNDILSDTDNVYIRNKNSYYPLTKSILKINATDTILSVAHNIDGTSNNNVTLTTNENILKGYIEKFTKKPEINITPDMINSIISTKNGFVKNLTDTSLEIYPKIDIDTFDEKIKEHEEKLRVNTNNIDNLKNYAKIIYILLSSNYDEVYQTLENNQKDLYVLKYKNQNYFKVGKSNGQYYFFSINKKTQTGFIDIELIELYTTGANLYNISITPSEVKAI